MVHRIKEKAKMVNYDTLGRPVIKLDEEGKIYHLTHGWNDAMKMVICHIEKDFEWVKVFHKALETMESGIYLRLLLQGGTRKTQHKQWKSTK